MGINNKYLIDIIFNKLFEAEEEYTKNNRLNISSFNVTKIDLTEILKTKYIPNKIKQYIISKNNSSSTIEININSRHFKVTFSNFTGKIKLNNLLNDNCIKSIFLLFYFLSEYANDKCGKNIDINIFLTPFKKTIPKNRNDSIGINNVNSGYSTAGCYNNTFLVIYRYEEWYKVLIHELFHNLNLDFSTSNIKGPIKLLSEKFGVKSDYCFFETYCEMWARILNVCIKSFIKTNINSSYNLRKTIYNKNFYKNIEIERIFTLKQSAKIINRFEKYQEYKEDSNVFCCF